MIPVLMLNASYEPLHVIDHRRALTLLASEKAELLERARDGREIRSPTVRVPMPAVIRLRRYINVPRRGARWSRRGVLQRDGYRCIYCGIQAGESQRGRVLTKGDFTVDHLIPRSRGGQNTWGNTACACPVCNHRKGDRTPSEAHMRPLHQPFRPRYLALAVVDLPAAWRKYV